jgi:glucose/mannose transport system substrate-binding protein
MMGNFPMQSSSRLMRTVFALAACVVGAGACSDEDAPTGSVRIMHWWNAGGEKQAIDALVGEFGKRHPSIRVVDASVDGGSTEQRDQLETLFQIGLLPDTFQANGGWGLMAWVLYNNQNTNLSRMAPIDDLAEEWVGSVPDRVMDSVNTLFYNKELFAAIGLHPEENPEELADLSQLFRAADMIREKNQGMTPIALGYGNKQDWSMSLLFFENLLAGRREGALYEELFDNPLRFDPFSPEFEATLEDFRTLMSYANDDANDLPWDKAMARVLRGEAAMTIMGDWAKGYADAQEEEEYRNAYGFIPMPGTAKTFVFTTDTFGLPKKSEEQQVANTKELLRFFGSADGQQIFNLKKGSISARTDVEIPAGDNRQATFAAFSDDAIKKIAATSLRAPQTWVNAVSKALATFATDWKDGTPSEVQHTMKNYSDVLQDACLLLAVDRPSTGCGLPVP